LGIYPIFRQTPINDGINHLSAAAFHRRASGVDAAPNVAVAVGAARGRPQAVAGEDVPGPTDTEMRLDSIRLN